MAKPLENKRQVTRKQEKRSALTRPIGAARPGVDPHHPPGRPESAADLEPSNTDRSET